MTRKRTRGMTLVELILALGLLAVLSAAVGTVMVSAARSYALTARMQEDEYNARLALLSISREIHRGVQSVSAAPVTGGYELRLESVNGTDIIIFNFSEGMLTRSVIGSTPVTFVPVELKNFEAPARADGRIEIRVVCTNGMELSTVVSPLRVPLAEPGEGV